MNGVPEEALQSTLLELREKVRAQVDNIEIVGKSVGWNEVT